MRFGEFSDGYDSEEHVRVCTEIIADDLAVAEADTINPVTAHTKGPARKKTKSAKFWPSLDVKIDKNRAYETSHILVTTEDSYSDPERCFMLACIHSELYLHQKAVSGMCITPETK
jgi:hypothetical protein